MTGKSKELLQKVYDYLDTIEVNKLSMREIQDFLEVVQKGQFLESLGQMPVCAPGAFNAPFNGITQNRKTRNSGAEGETAAEK